MAVRVIEVRQSHRCAWWLCGEWIHKGEYAVPSGRDRYHPGCYEEMTGKSVDYQPRLFGDKDWFCRKCGTKNPAEAKYCTYCGMKKEECEEE